MLFVFVLFLQADPLLGLLGFGGGMDFDSDKAYRYDRDGFLIWKQIYNCSI